MNSVLRFRVELRDIAPHIRREIAWIGDSFYAKRFDPAMVEFDEPNERRLFGYIFQQVLARGPAKNQKGFVAPY